MAKRFLFLALMFSLLVQACSAPPSLPSERNAPTAIVSQPESVVPTAEPTQETVPVPALAATPLAETTSSDCLGGEVSPIGKSIAEDYDFTSYEEVITWFCNGAEFEDILVALETESQTE